MNNWMLSKVKLTRQLESGRFKRVSEQYLFAAMTFSHAEERTYKEVGELVRGEFQVLGIARQEFHDIFSYDDADVWYKCTIAYENQDADSEKVSKVKNNFLVTASSVKEATERIRESLSTLMVDYEITAVVKSPILDVFPFEENLDKEISRRPLETTEQ